MTGPSADPSARRPLKSRDVPFFRGLARSLAGMGVTPNAISCASMVFGCGAGVALAATAHVSHGWALRGCFLGAAALIQLRLLCNLIDGLVAVECGKKTPTGDVWNELPDRISDAGTLGIPGEGPVCSGPGRTGPSEIANRDRTRACTSGEGSGRAFS